MSIEKKEIKFIKKLKSLSTKTIPLYLNSIDELLEYSNYAEEKNYRLKDSVKEYLEEEAGKITINYKIKIEVHLRNKNTSEIHCDEIIHSYYESKLENRIEEHKKEVKSVRLKFVIGILFLALFHTLSYFIGKIGDTDLSEILQDSFEIMGWVAVWEPTTYLLFTRTDKHKEISDYFQLKHSEISVNELS